MDEHHSGSFSNHSNCQQCLRWVWERQQLYPPTNAFLSNKTKSKWKIEIKIKIEIEIETDCCTSRITFAVRIDIQIRGDLRILLEAIDSRSILVDYRSCLVPWICCCRCCCCCLQVLMNRHFSNLIFFYFHKTLNNRANLLFGVQ